MIFNSNPAVKVIRRTLKEIEENGELQDDKTLLMWVKFLITILKEAKCKGVILNTLFRDGKEIAVAYFRAGYTPKDYYSEKVIKFLMDQWKYKEHCEFYS